MQSVFEAFKACRNVLVLDLGFLGDTIHLIPSLHLLRQSLPEARLEVLVGDHIKSIMQVTPWVDRVWGYPRFPTSEGLVWHLGFIKELRAQGYDGIINLNGSDRSSFLTRLSGAPLRLGRKPPKDRWYLPHCFTHQTDSPFDRPCYLQRLKALENAGFPQSQPRFATEVPAAIDEKVKDLLDGETGFFHISPFTTQDQKELPLRELAKLIDGLHERCYKVVVSTAPNNRERSKIAELRGLLKGPKPWRVFNGELTLVELAAVIGRSHIHLGGDSGALHVALMMERPTLSWWRDYAGRIEWQPQGKQHHAVIGATSIDGQLDVTAAALLEELETL